MVPLRVHESEEKINEWALVLASYSIDYDIVPEGRTIVLYVPASDAERSEKILREYESENPRDLIIRREEKAVGINFSGAIVSFLFLLFFIAIKVTGSDTFFYTIGSASAALILRGELWRTVTALFLHADLLHAVSNSFSCIVFCTPVCRLYGFGTGWFLILLSGAVGNFITALLYRSGHDAIGASTAIFGAIGLLGAWRAAFGRKYQLLRKRAWIYAAVVLALLGLLGSGQNVDLLAHLMGTISGVFFGFAASKKIDMPALSISPKFQSRLAAFTTVCVFLAWFCALYIT